MKVFVLQSKTESAFTTKEDGSNLPSVEGGWTLFKVLDMNRDETPRIGVNTDECLDAIERDGFHRVGAKRLKVKIID